MIITYFGKQFFKISQGELALAFNPIGKDSAHKDKASRFGADIAFVTINHPDFNGVETVSYGDKTPFAVLGPGDYETREIFIKGVGMETEIGKKKYINTAYCLSVDEIKICFLGHASGELSSEIKEAAAGADILFVPIGGEGVFNPKEASKASLALEPKLIIPMDYGSERQKDSLKVFLKEGGAEKTEPVEKLSIKKKDLEAMDGEIAVLKY